LITEMLEICIQTSYDQNVQLILKSYLPVVLGTTLKPHYLCRRSGLIQGGYTVVTVEYMYIVMYYVRVGDGWYVLVLTYYFYWKNQRILVGNTELIFVLSYHAKGLGNFNFKHQMVFCQPYLNPVLKLLE